MYPDREKKHATYIIYRMENYAARTTTIDEADAEMMPDLTELEKKLLASQEMFKIRGKVGYELVHK